MRETSTKEVSSRERFKFNEHPILVRFCNSDDPEEMERLLTTVKGAAVQKNMEDVEDMTMKDVMEWAEQRGEEDQDETLFAIAGCTSFVGTEEDGKLQGFVNCYSVDENLVKRMRDQGIISDANDLIFQELGYANYPGARLLQTFSGVVEACRELKKMKGENLQVYNFVSPSNKASQTVMEMCGFEKVGEIDYEEGAEVKDWIYRSNWQRLDEIHTEIEEGLK